jgi:Prokaryotic lipoprotein-attachment site
MLARQIFFGSTFTFGAASMLAGCGRKGSALQNFWNQWQSDWRRIETGNDSWRFKNRV